MTDSSAPSTFGKYTLTRRIAQGGMAEIFLATRPDKGTQQLALKRILPNFSSEKEFVAMFITEAKVAAQLAHPNIIQIFDLGFESGHYFIAMEYLDGWDMEAVAKANGGKLPPLIVARIAAWLASALHYANTRVGRDGHPLNVIHRDVTPGNVMLTWSGQAKLVDFGIAKATDQLERTRPGVVKGKFRYMSPEQIDQQELDGRSDLFSLGVLLYETTTGVKPFERKQILQTLQAVRGYDPPPPSDLVREFPPALSRIVMKALEKDRDRRYRNGKELADELEAFLATQPPTGPAEIAALMKKVMKPRSSPAPGPLEEPPPPAKRPAAPTRAVPSLGEDDEDRRTEHLGGDKVRAMMAEADRRQAMKSAAPLPPGAKLRAGDFDERTRQLGDDELDVVRETSGKRKSGPNLARDHVLGPDDDEEDSTRSDRKPRPAKKDDGWREVPTNPLPPPDAKTDPAKPYPAKGSKSYVDTARDKPPPPVAMDPFEDVTDTTATDQRPRFRRGTDLVRATRAQAGRRLLTVAIVLCALGALALGWLMREYRHRDAPPPQLEDGVDLAPKKVGPRK